MAIITRIGKGSALTHAELDNNFSELLSSKANGNHIANIADYGAVGDGTTNDTAAFNAAIATGKAVFVPIPSVSYTTSGITLADDQILFGIGYKSKIKFTGTERCITVGNRSKVSNLQIIGSGKASGLQFETGVFAFQKVGWALSDLYINNFGGVDAANGGGGIQVTTLGAANQDGGTVTNVYLKDNNCGLNIADRGEYTLYTNIQAINCNTGIKCQAGNISLNNVSIQGCGVGLKLVTGANDGHSNFTGVMANHNTVNLSSVGVINGNSFTACKFYAGDIELNNNTGLRFTNCDFSIGTLTLTANTSVQIALSRYPKGATAGAMTVNLVSGAAIQEVSNLDF